VFYFSTKIPIIIDENDLIEKFVRGSGKGGQKINKTSSKVQLHHVPSGLKIACQEQRDLTSNRRIARKILCDKLDVIANGENSKLCIKHEKIRKRKSKAKYRATKKYGNIHDPDLIDKDDNDN
jgi:protein subunit release factor B